MSSTASPEDSSGTEAPGVVDPDLRSARRTLAFFVIAVAAVIAGVVVVLSGSRDDGAPTLTGDAGTGEEVVATAVIGPAPGADLVSYARERRTALDGAEGRRVAVVSLTGYSTVEIVDDLLEGLELHRHLVALVGGEPRATTDVDAEVADAVGDAEAQLAELREIEPTVEDDPDYERFYASEIERYEQLLAAADRGDVVFGLVVSGPVADLRTLASRASVRLVDIGPSDRLDDGAVVRGLRPEEAATAGTPPVRP